jgi:hypothetical protein
MKEDSMSILGVGAGAALDGLTGGGASAFESALSAAGGGGSPEQQLQQKLGEGMLTMMAPMLMNMVEQTTKIMKGDSSGLL